MSRNVSIMADTDNCSITLTGEAAIKVWNYIIEEVYIQRPLEIDIEPKSLAKCVSESGVLASTGLKEGYLGKV